MAAAAQEVRLAPLPRRAVDLVAAMRRYRALTRGIDTRARLLELRQRRLRETIRHAAASSPFYKELYAGIDLDDELDVSALPSVTKDALMERFDEWVCDPRLKLSAVERHIDSLTGDQLYLDTYRCMPTGGTTGTRGVFVYDRSEWRDCLCAFMRWSELGGMAPRPGRRLRIASVGATSPLHMTARFGMSIDVGLLDVARLDARTALAQLAAALDVHQPQFLTGYPSILSLLAIEQLEGRLSIAPAIVGTSSEVRTQDMHANIVAAWGCEPFDLYGTTESVYAGDCEHHTGMHIFEDLGMVEVVDDAGRPVAEGVVGSKLLVTSFIKRNQPVVRYEVSDLAAISSEPCPCGRPFARFLSVQGRSDDVLRLRGLGGRDVAVHPIVLRSPMAGIAGLRQYKVIHESGALHVQVVLRDGVDAGELSAGVRAALTEKLVAAGVSAPRIEVAVVDEIARGSGHSAKFKLVESR